MLICVAVALMHRETSVVSAKAAHPVFYLQYGGNLICLEQIETNFVGSGNNAIGVERTAAMFKDKSYVVENSAITR